MASRGMDKILKGVLLYRQKWKNTMLEQFNQFAENPSLSAVFLTCADSRLLPSRYTQTHAGDMFIARNVGNIIPHAKHYDPQNPFPEPAVLELGVIRNGIKNVIICGHSDCRAMQALHGIGDVSSVVMDTSYELSSNTPINSWLRRYGTASLMAYQELQKSEFTKPLQIKCTSSTGLKDVSAFIDVENAFDGADKLSQVNTLIQMENIASYPFIQKYIKTKKTQIHALWYDIHSAEVYIFSKVQKHFVPILDSNVDQILQELNNSNDMSNEDATAFVKTASDIVAKTKC